MTRREITRQHKPATSAASFLSAHPRESGGPGAARRDAKELDSRLRGNERSMLLRPGHERAVTHKQHRPPAQPASYPLTPAKAGVQEPRVEKPKSWIPAYAGMSGACCCA